MKLEELEAKVKILEDKVRILDDIEEIKKLQRAYGYYLQNQMTDDVVDLFADRPETSLKIAAGEFKGLAGIKRYFAYIKNKKSPEFLHQVMQISGIVDVAPDGKTAMGRWYGFGANALIVEGGISQGWMNGVYEDKYIKEDGKWKMFQVWWCPIFNCNYKDGWVAPERLVERPRISPYRPGTALAPDGPPEVTTYPSGFVCPYHFKNPVSGR